MSWSEFEGLTWNDLPRLWRAMERKWQGYGGLTWDDLEGTPWSLFEQGLDIAKWSDYSTFTWDDLRRYTWNAVKFGVPKPQHAGPLDISLSNFGQIISVPDRVMTIEVTSLSVAPLNVASPLVTSVLDDHQDLEVFEVLDIYA